MILSGEVHHRAVAAYFVQESRAGSKFFTNDYVMDEAWTRLITNQSLASAKALRAKTKEAERQRQLLVLWTDESIFNRTWKNFTKFAEHKLSFTDAVIVAIVEDLKIDEILTLDRGFKKIGLTIRPILEG